MSRPVRALAWLVAAAGLLVSGIVFAAHAQSLAATKVAPSLTFSGSGTSQTVVTRVTFTSTYNGAYYVRYDLFRSTSKTKSSPVRMTTTTISQTFSTTTKGLTYSTATTSKSCAPNSTRTTFYYWLVGSVSDGGSGVVTVNSTPVAKVGCTSVF
jgi:hypothetical protein